MKNNCCAVITRSKIACVILLHILCYSGVYAQQQAEQFQYSQHELEDILSKYYSKTRASLGPCRWSAVFQQKSEKTENILILVANARSEISVVFGSHDLSSSGSILIEQKTTIKSDDLINEFKFKIIKNIQSNDFMNLVKKFKSIQINAFDQNIEYLDSDSYKIEINNPPMNLIINLNSIDAKKSPMAAVISKMMEMISKAKE